MSYYVTKNFEILKLKQVYEKYGKNVKLNENSEFIASFKKRYDAEHYAVYKILQSFIKSKQMRETVFTPNYEAKEPPEDFEVIRNYSLNDNKLISFISLLRKPILDELTETLSKERLIKYFGGDV